MTTPQPPVPGADQLWLGEFLTAVLDKAAQVLGPLAPARRYVSAGRPVPDCNQLTVHLDAIRSSDPLTRPKIVPGASLADVPVAILIVTLYVCSPGHASIQDALAQGLLPTATDLNDDGLTMAQAGQALWYGLVAASVDGTLWPLQNKPAVLFRTLTQLEPAGGLAGWQLLAEVSLT